MGDDAHMRDAVVGMLMRHRNSLHAFVLAAVRDLDLAEDVLQDVSLAICSSWKSYDPSQPFLRWARAVARNRVRDIFRCRRRSREILDPDVVERAVSLAGESGEMESWTADLERCLERLGERARAVLRRRYVQREKPSAIASAMGWKAQSVYVLLSRAKRALLECLRGLAGAREVTT